MCVCVSQKNNQLITNVQLAPDEMEINTTEDIREMGNNHGNWEATINDDQIDGVRQNVFTRRARTGRSSLRRTEIGRRLKNYSSFETFIHQIFKSIEPDLGMNGMALRAYNDMATHFICSIVRTAEALAQHGGRKTISAKDIKAAIHLKLGAMNDEIGGGHKLYTLLDNSSETALNNYNKAE